VLELLRERQAHVILGNHDKIVLSPGGERLRSSPDISRELLGEYSAIPDHLFIELGGKRFAIFHGSPWDSPRALTCQYVYPHESSRLLKADLNAHFIILGHTHIPMVQHVGRYLVVNPGSCGEARTSDRQLSCAVIDVAEGTAEIRTFAEIWGISGGKGLRGVSLEG
jgi:putative phosphoesterase